MASIPVFSHVVLVAMENKGFGQIIGPGQPTTNAPYINNTLAAGGALFTAYHAPGHPSFPNYFVLVSGSTWGSAQFQVGGDKCPPTGFPFTGANIGSLLLGKGLTFLNFVENLPANHQAADSAPYYGHHNPIPFFSNVPASATVDFTTFPATAAGYAALPTVSLVIPNGNHDMHDGTNPITLGDTWLQANLDGYAQWAKLNNSLLIVWWDEDYGANDNPPEIFYGANVKPGRYSETPLSHVNILRTLCDMYGLTAPGGAATATPITDIWTTGPPPPQALSIDTTSIPAATAGVFYTTTLAASGGTAPYAWSAPVTPGTTAKPQMATGADINSMFAADPATTRVFFDRPDAFAICHSPTASELTAPLACTLILNYKSYAQFAADIAAGAITFPYSWVMYDNETWSFTPVGEQNDPFTFMASFITLAHAHGFKVMCTPARDLATAPAPVQPRIGGETDDTWYNRVNIAGSAASSGADIVEIQDQANTLNLAEFGLFFNTAKNLAVAAKPAVAVWCGVSVTYGTAAQMAQAARSVPADGYWLNSLGNITQSDQFLLAMVPTSTGGGGLPTGVTLNATTGVLSGTPPNAGSFPFTAKVTDKGSPVQSDTQALTLTVGTGPPPPATLTITTPALPAAQTGTPYQMQLAASGGTGTLTWSETGALPAGFTLTTGGLLAGTTTTAGTFPLTFRVADSAGHAATAQLNLTVGTTPPPPPPPAGTPVPMGGGISATLVPADVFASTAVDTYGFIAAQDVLPQNVT